MLIAASEWWEAGLCRGCGQPAAECHDTDMEWEVTTVECGACAALETARKGDLPPGALLLVHSRGEGAMAGFDPVRAAREHAEHLARFV